MHMYTRVPVHVEARVTLGFAFERRSHYVAGFELIQLKCLLNPGIGVPHHTQQFWRGLGGCITFILGMCLCDGACVEVRGQLVGVDCVSWTEVQVFSPSTWKVETSRSL